MHVGGIKVDLNSVLQLIFTLFVIACGLLYVVKNTASKYFEVDANFDRSHQNDAAMPATPIDPLSCAVCGKPANKKCSRCKSVRYCSPTCQSSDWHSGHKTNCKDSSGGNSKPIEKTNVGLKSSGAGDKSLSRVAHVPARDTSMIMERSRKVLFPYDEFVKFFNWDKPGFLPCGLLNCGNSCFANVVLQCLMFTRPLVAYLLEKGHRRECKRNDWCFLCEFQSHVERASQSPNPFSPISILSRLPNIGGNLGYGRQEDAHEFMRFAIDTMQSVCLDEFGGEKAVPASFQETTLIQHIFGGHLQSQVICTTCNKISNQYENMMDLTVEIHGDAASLEECLDQFTAKEWLHGENMYKCDGCNDYVKAWKRLTVRRAPNILTIALKRFQSGRFGKLNKRVSFPETLDLSPYMSEEGDGTDLYKLYAVVVHVDMLNASFFGHYICYTKDFCGNWYRLDDSKVISVELEEVLSQGAYMLLYSRVRARPSCLRTVEHPKEQEADEVEVDSSQKGPVGSFSNEVSIGPASSSGSPACNRSSHLEVSGCDKESSVGINSGLVSDNIGYHDDVASTSTGNSHGKNYLSAQINCEATRGCLEDVDIVNSQSPVGINPELMRVHVENGDIIGFESNLSASVGIPNGGNDSSLRINSGAIMECDIVSSQSCLSGLKDVLRHDEDLTTREDQEVMDMVDCESTLPLSDEVPCCKRDLCVAVDSEAVIKDAVELDMVNSKSYSSIAEDIKDYDDIGLQSGASAAIPHNLKRESSFQSLDFRYQNGAKRAEIVNGVCNNGGSESY